ncbi:phosphatidylglycerophosphatase B [Serratia symbiotica]|nr:phosphatidylglycerophosphatase B [Serratia symbiotica]
MHEMAKRTAVGALLLLIMPMMLWVSDWHWCPGSNEMLLKGLYWVTATVTSPWRFLTSIFLSVWFLWCLCLRHKAAIGLVMLLSAAMLIGQGIKSMIKDRVQESRPFVVWLEQNHGVDEKYFYSLHSKQRSALVAELSQERNLVPIWLSKHWQFETGFAFPSGHTLFAATWALLGVGLLWPRRHYKTVVLLMIWAAGVMGSRLMLGMHWPRDLVMATFISWLLVTLTCWLAQRWYGLLMPLQGHQGLTVGKSQK